MLKLKVYSYYQTIKSLFFLLGFGFNYGLFLIILNNVKYAYLIYKKK